MISIVLFTICALCLIALLTSEDFDDTSPHTDKLGSEFGGADTGHMLVLVYVEYDFLDT